MSAEKNRREGLRWLLQAQDDFGAAESLAMAQKWAQSAFFLHQAGEKALKAVAFLSDENPWGHSITQLISELPEPLRSDFEHLKNSARVLDKLYIPTRYPDSVPDIIPKDAFSREDVDRAKQAALEILEKAEEKFR